MPEPSQGSAGDTFHQVLSAGPTDIPDSDDVTAALASVLPSDAQSDEVDAAEQTVGTAAAVYDELEEQEQQQPGHRPGNDPFRSGLIGWALSPMWFGLDALKWAGQTVNERAVAPVARLASPAGWASYIFEGVKNLTPQRARDLARIFGNATIRGVGLTTTPSGQKVVAAGLHAVDAFATTVSSPVGRQLVIDGATTFIKVAEACETPQAKDAMQQCAVLAARFFDVLASNESKALLQVAADAACRVAELAASREATVMAAEFTANVVHALEMEHLQHAKHLPREAAAVIAAAPVDDDEAAAEYLRAANGGLRSAPATPLRRDGGGSGSADADAASTQQSASPGSVTGSSEVVTPARAAAALAADAAAAAAGAPSVDSDSDGGGGVSQAQVLSPNGKLLRAAPPKEPPPQHGARLPRYTREHFESVLTKRVQPVSEQLPAATAASLEASLSAAAARRVARQLDAAAEVYAEESRAHARGDAQACAALAALVAWTLLGLYGLSQLVFAGRSGGSASMGDEL